MQNTLKYALLAGSVLVGCGIFTSVDEDNFYEVYAEEGCQKTKECYRAIFDGEYDGDMDECVDTQVDYFEDYQDYFDDCDFDDDKAKDCISSIKAADCGELYDDYEDVFEDCVEVWDCN